ncbi:MAG: response regulator transcription factor [Chloroflexi bacterium]|nr:response regulator transcription factor [Chloroflexota bacterium]
MNKIRVLVADDQIFAIEGLSHIVSESTDMEVIGHATTIMEVLDLTDKMHPDVIVLDMAWQGDKLAGIKAIPQIKEKKPDIIIVAVTVYSELIDAARKAGAFPLEKGFSKKTLLDTIRWAVKTKGLNIEEAVSLRKEIEGLTDRENEVLTYVGEGLSDKQIAQQLKIAEGTVKKHIGSILRKLGASNRAEAAVIAERGRRL